MLQSMRNIAHTPVVKGLMLLLAVSFALWGIGDIFRGNPLERSVAKVGKKSITVQQLNREFEQDLALARRQIGPDLSAQQAKQMGLLDKSLQTMIQRSAVDQAVEKLGLDISQKMVLDEFAKQPQFRDQNGKFNTAMFKQLLQHMQMDEHHFLAEGQNEMKRHLLFDAFATTAQPPQTMTDNLYKARGQKRIFDTIAVKNDSMTNIPAPTDKDLHDYYQQNIQNFTAPEYRSITIARLSTDDVAKDIVVTDEQLKKEYDSKPADFAQPERRDIVQVVTQDEAKARQLSSDAKKNGNLTASAKAIGYNSVSLNQTEEKALPAELAKPVFALHGGQISDPVHTGLGWHVVEVKKISPASSAQFKDIKESLRKDMQRDQAIESATKLVNQLDDELAAGHPLEDIADSMKLRLIKIPSLGATGLTADGKTPPELPNKEQILKTAYAQGTGDVSPILDDKNGNYFIVRTDAITPSAPKTFESVKDDVTDAWRKDQKVKAAKEVADKIAQGLRDGKELSSLTNQKGVSYRKSEPVSLLGDSDEDFPPSILLQAFKLKKGEVATAAGEGKQIVLRLSAVSEAAPADDSAKLKITDEIRKNASNELTQEYLGYLNQLFKVEIDQERLEAIKQQGS